jgi:hypothetical protein
MDPKHLQGLMEAYSEVYVPQQIDELSVNKMNAYINKAEKDRGRLNKKWDQGTATSKERKKVFDREEGEARASKKIRQKTGKDSFRLNALDKLKSAITKEEVDLFDTVLEFLYVEGYAETLEEAEWLMANVIDEQAIDIITELTGGKGHPGYKAGSRDRGPMQSGHSADSEKRKDNGGTMSQRYGDHLGDIDDNDDDEDGLETIVKQQSRDSRANVRKPLRNKVQAARKVLSKEQYVDESGKNDARIRGNIKSFGSNYTPPRDWDQSANRGQGAVLNAKQKEKQRRKGLRQEEYMDEAQEARNNPEKYEREQSKKSAPVRGERTPMPPRGDKRREDFEKWYAANVR